MTTGSSSTSRTLLVIALAVLVGLAAVYVTLGGRDNGSSNVARTTTSSPLEQPGRLNIGHMAAFVFKKEPEPLTEFSFVDANGTTRTLADWKGRLVLLNLWATWCAPCRKEMPDLARLQKDLGSPRFEVVALAVDRAGRDAITKFLGSIDASSLALYIDPTARAGTALKAAGMPTTLLIDGRGREIGRLTGAAEWDSADAKRLIQAHMK